MRFSRAVLEIVIEEGSIDTANSKEDEGPKALASFQTDTKEQICTHCGRD